MDIMNNSSIIYVLDNVDDSIKGRINIRAIMYW